ncbi:MAG: ANTAR domain-containing protein [Candidatus Limnocylindrales bacterium]
MISQEQKVTEVAAATEREHPDLAFVGLGISGLHALEMISEIAGEASCPVIALLESEDARWVNEAAKRGIFAYIVNGNPGEMQSAIDITLRRYAEYANLEGAFARRAVIERAKGIMMARQAIDERKAFELLRAQSQNTGRRLIQVAESVVESHLLLVPPTS